MAQKDGNTAVAGIAGIAGGAAITMAIMNAKKAKAAAPEDQQDVYDMYISLLESMNQLSASVQMLASQIGVDTGAAPAPGGSGGGTAKIEDAFKNYPRFATGQVLCPAINTGYQLPGFPIPRNKQLVVKALPTNAGTIYIAYSQGQSQNFNVAYPMVANEGVGLFLENSNQLWVAIPPAPLGALNDGIAFIVETS